jgi:hypothetical protein
LLAKAATEPNGVVCIQAIRDFGKETKMVYAPLYVDPPVETHKIHHLDELTFGELYTLQISLGDLDDNIDPPDTWELHTLQLKIGKGLTA